MGLFMSKDSEILLLLLMKLKMFIVAKKSYVPINAAKIQAPLSYFYYQTFEEADIIALGQVVKSSMWLPFNSKYHFGKV